jgi:hypothetical protein
MGTDITQGLPLEVQQAIAPAQSGPQPTGFNGPQGNTYDSGVARVPAPQIPLRPSDQPDDSEAPDIHPVDAMASAFIGHLIDKDKPVQPAPSTSGRQPGSFADKLAGAASALGTGLGDMRTGGDPGQGHGWLSAVGATLNARSERVSREKQQQFENSERLKSDQVNLAQANMNMVMHARAIQMQDKTIRDAGAASSAHFMDTMRDNYKVQDNINQSKIGEMMTDPQFARTHTARITGYEPMLGADGKPKMDSAGLPIESPLYSVVNIGAGDTSTQYTVPATVAKKWADAGLQSVPPGTMMPASAANKLDVQAERYGTTLGLLNLGKVQPLPSNVKDQMVSALQDPEVQHAVAMQPGSPLAGLYDAQATVAQHVTAAQQQLDAAQKSGNPQAVQAAQDNLKKVQLTAQNVDSTINNGFTDGERNSYAKQKEAEDKEAQKEAHENARDAETARHNRAEEVIKRAEGGNSPEDINNAAELLATANEDPSQLSKRAKGYQKTIDAAADYSWAKYGKPWSPADAQSEYKYATTSQNQNVLKLINGVVEPNGALEIAQKAAQGLTGFDNQTLNKVFNTAKAEFGDAKITDFHTAMLGLADEYSKIMGGGNASDTGRQQALDLLKDAYSKGQMAGAVAIIKKDIAARQKAIIGNNRYLQRQYLGPQGITTTMIAPNGQKQEIPASQVDYFKAKGAHIQTKDEYNKSLPAPPPVQ